MPLVFPTPPISLSTAHAFTAFFAFSYVGSLYASKNARLSFKNGVSANVRDGEERSKESDERWRNDPEVIRARLLAASLSTIGSMLAVHFLVRSVIPDSEVCQYAYPSWFVSKLQRHGSRVAAVCSVMRANEVPS